MILQAAQIARTHGTTEGAGLGRPNLKVSQIEAKSKGNFQMEKNVRMKRRIRPVQLIKEDYQVKEKIFLRYLSNAQRKTLQKFNPFRTERNALIRCLARRGVTQVLLSKVSGLSPVQIFRIVHNTKKGGDGNEN